MKTHAAASRFALCLLVSLSPCLLVSAARPDGDADLARQAREVLRSHCHRCHGQDGALEGGMNYVLDLDRLVARRKVVAGRPDESPLFKRVSAGKMPPPGAEPR